jgi:hypothetical protein
MQGHFKRTVTSARVVLRPGPAPSDAFCIRPETGRPGKLANAFQDRFGLARLVVPDMDLVIVPSAARSKTPIGEKAEASTTLSCLILDCQLLARRGVENALNLVRPAYFASVSRQLQNCGAHITPERDIGLKIARELDIDHQPAGNAPGIFAEIINNRIDGDLVLPLCGAPMSQSRLTSSLSAI